MCCVPTCNGFSLVAMGVVWWPGLDSQQEGKVEGIFRWSE